MRLNIDPNLKILGGTSCGDNVVPLSLCFAFFVFLTILSRASQSDVLLYLLHMTAVSIRLNAQLLSLFASSCCCDRLLLSRLSHIRIISAERSICLLQQFTQCLQVPASSKTCLWAFIKCLQVPASSKTGLWAFYLMSVSVSHVLICKQRLDIPKLRTGRLLGMVMIF